MNSENPYTSLPRIKAVLRSLDLRPTRAMGQNFLFDAQTLTAIADAAELTQNDTVVEVGPGLGVLTWELLRRVRHVISVELDQRLAIRLRQEFAGAANLTIVEGDILQQPPQQLLSNAGITPLSQNYKVVANLPYAITSPSLRHFLEADLKPELMVVLVQWEVAKRIAAEPGDLSVLAHAIQLYAEPEIVERVQSHHFYPAPAVDSAILRLWVRPHPAADVNDRELLMRVIKAGFLHARKTLANALPSGLAAMGHPVNRDVVISVLGAAGVDPQRRAETVALEEWVSVYEGLIDAGIFGVLQ